MKKQKVSCGAFFCLFLLIFSTSIADTSRLSIVDLLSSSEAQWKEEFSDIQGNIIQIDTPITIPQVDTLPVVSVKWHSQLDDSIYDDYSEEGVKIPSKKVFDGTLNIRYHYDLDISPDWNINKLNVVRTFYYPNDTHVNNGNTLDWSMFAEANQYSFQDAYQIMVNKFQDFMHTYGNSNEKIDISLKYANTLDIIYKGEHPVNHEGYEFRCIQKLHGIPIVGNANAPYMWQNNAYLHESIYCDYVNLNFSSENSFSISALLWEKAGVLYDDIKVVPFETIKPKLISLIQEGHICEIYKIELAYLTYFNEYRDAKKGMILVPTWIVHCQYRFNTKDYSEIVPQETIYGSGGYQILAFNAQTGEYRDPMEKGIDRSDCPPIIVD